MQHHHSGGGDYSQIQPCGHFWGPATLEDACCMVDLVDAKPCKYINIKGDEVKHKQASLSSSVISSYWKTTNTPGGKLERKSD